MALNTTTTLITTLIQVRPKTTLKSLSKLSFIEKRYQIFRAGQLLFQIFDEIFIEGGMAVTNLKLRFSFRNHRLQPVESLRKSMS